MCTYTFQVPKLRFLRLVGEENDIEIGMIPLGHL